MDTKGKLALRIVCISEFGDHLKRRKEEKTDFQGHERLHIVKKLCLVSFAPPEVF